MQTLCDTKTVIDVLQDKVGVPASTPLIESATWEDLGVESLGLSETIATLEIQLGIEIPTEKALQTKNVAELVRLINAQVQV